LPERFGEDIGGIVGRFDTGDGDFAIRDLVADVMIFYVDVLDPRVPHVILHEEGCSIIIAVQRCRGR
jgi:hypothetical protein